MLTISIIFTMDSLGEGHDREVIETRCWLTNQEKAIKNAFRERKRPVFGVFDVLKNPSQKRSFSITSYDSSRSRNS